MEEGLKQEVGTTGLRFWRWWLVLGLLMVLIVVYLSLANVRLPQVPSSAGDKFNHLIAYGVLAGWFGQLFTARKRILLLAFLVLLGILLEVLQGMTPYRYFDWFDAVANTLGVLTAMLALHFGADKILLWFESRYLKAS